MNEGSVFCWFIFVFGFEREDGKGLRFFRVRREFCGLVVFGFFFRFFGNGKWVMDEVVLLIKVKKNSVFLFRIFVEYF